MRTYAYLIRPHHISFKGWGIGRVYGKGRLLCAEADCHPDHGIESSCDQSSWNRFIMLSASWDPVIMRSVIMGSSHHARGQNLSSLIVFLVPCLPDSRPSALPSCHHRASFECRGRQGSLLATAINYNKP